MIAFFSRQYRPMLQVLIALAVTGHAVMFLAPVLIILRALAVQRPKVQLPILRDLR
jgi:hypothetical protein